MPTPDPDQTLMARAIELAAHGIGHVEPNPPVGCVIAREGRIVGEGHHAEFGGPHAEVVALREAGEAARGADLYVSLEPCCHHGKTPPCTDAIIAAGVRRVVAAVQDPFPRVAGGGLNRLREAGIEVHVGVREADARRAAAAFFKVHETGLPLVIAKWAMTLDGRIAAASGDSRWISSEASRRRVHEVRRISDAVLIGGGTARRDAPSLTVRHVEPIPRRGQPTRVVFDETLMLVPEREPFASAREAPVIIYTTAHGRRTNRRLGDLLEEAGCTVVAVRGEGTLIRLRSALEDLARRGMSRVLLEGGAGLFGSFFAAGLVDRLMVFVAPKVLADSQALGPVAGPPRQTIAEALSLTDVTAETVGPDVLVEGRVGDY